MSNNNCQPVGDLNMKLYDICPRCFSERGFSIKLENERDVFFCPKDSQHRFKKDDNGYFVENQM